MGRIGVAAAFSKQAQFVAQNASAFGLTYDAVRLVIRGNPDTTVIVKDTTIAFTPSSHDVTLDLAVPVLVDGQKFNATLDYTSKTAGVLFHGALVVTSYRPGRSVPPQQEITLDYVGPGATVARLAITPDTTTVIGNASASLTVSAFDAKGTAIATPPLLWASSNSAIVAIVGTGDKIAAQGQNVRGNALVSVISPSGAADTSTIAVTLPPASIIVASGAGQTGVVHTGLAAPAVVQVNAVDGIGVPGVSVVFAAPEGGSVGTTSVTTDANGRASTTMTLGTLAGPQGFAATAAGLSVAINATGIAGSAAAVAVASGNSQADTVSKTLAALSVRVADAFSNAIPNAVVTWTRVRGSGTLTSATSTTNANGIATNNYILGTIAGSDSIAVSAGSATIAGFTFTTKPGNPAAITAVSTAAPTASVGAVLDPFVVKVVDANGNPIEGAVVTWTPTNGTFAVPTTTTDPDGQTSNKLTLGGVVGAAGATATIGGKSITFNATAAAGAGAQLAFSTEPVGVVNNVTLPVVAVSVRDSFGNLVTTSTPVTIAFGVNPIGATLSGTLTKNTVNGVATFDDLKVDRAGVGFTFVASSGSIGATPSTAFTIGASGSAQLLLIPASPTSFTKQAGAAVSNAPSLRVVNGSGLPIANAPVRFVTTLGVTPIGDVTLNADANGTISASSIATPDVVGVYTITATSTSAPGSTVSATLNVTPGVAAALVFTAPAGTTQYSAQIGAAISPAVTVAVRDAFGNAVPSLASSISVALTSANGATLSGTTTSNVVGGAATFSNLSINLAQNGYTLTATAIGLTSATSLPINILAPGGLQLAFVTSIVNGVANTAITPAIAVQARDAQGQLVTTATPAVSLSISSGPSGATIVGGGPVTAVNGIATFTNVKLTKAGAYSLIATGAGVAPSTSTSFTIAAAGPAAQMTKVAGDNLSALVNTSIAVPPRVLVTDGSGNPVEGAQVGFQILSGSSTIKRAPSDGPLTSATVQTDVNGFATLDSWTMGPTATTNSLTVNLIGTGVSLTFSSTATSGAASAIAIVSGGGQSGTVGAALAPFVVKVTDASGNAVSGVTVVWAATNGALAATSTTAADGTASNALTLGHTPGPASATATIAGGKTVSFDATANVGLPAQFEFTTQPANAISGTPIPPVVVALRDQFGNATTGTNAVTIAIAANPSNGTLTGTLTRTAVAGVVTFDNLSIDKVGSGYTLTVTAGAVTSATSNAFNVLSGAAAQIAPIAGDNQSAVIGTAVPIAPRVKVTDASGNAVANASVTFTIASGAGSIRLTPATGQVTSGAVTTDASGFAAITTWTLGSLVGPNTLEAHLTANPVVSATFTAHSSNGPGAVIVAVSGTGQTGGAGAPLAQPFIVRVTDLGNNPVPGVTVTWAATDGTIATTTTTTAADGTTSATMTLGGVLGPASATASIAGVPSAVFSATVVAGSPALIAVTTQPPTTIASGAVLAPVTFAIRDAFGNPTNATNAVSIALTTPAGATLAGTLTRNAVGGTVTFGDLSIDKIGVYTLTASASGLAPTPTNAVTVTAGAAAHIAIVAGDNTTGVVGGPTSLAPQVHVTDAAGNDVPGATVTFVPGSGSGSVTPRSVNTDANGLASAAWTLGSVAGPYTLDASVVAVGPVTFHATATSGPPATIAIQSGDAQTAVVGTALTAPLVAHVADAANNAIVGAVVSWTATNGTVAPTSVTDANGNASTSLTLGHVAGASTATATTVNGQHVTFNESATAGAPFALAITTQPSTTTAALPITPAIAVGLRDSFGNVATGVNGVTISIGTNPGNGTLSGTLTRSAVNGTATFNDLLIQKAGVGYTLTVTSPGLTSATTNGFNIVAGFATQLAFTVQPSNTTAGAVIAPVAVTAIDAFGNPVTTSTGPITLAIANVPPPGTLSGTLTRAPVNGVATFNDLSIDHAGSGYTLSAASIGLRTATSSAFSVGVGAPAHITIVDGDGQSALVGQNTATAPKVKVTDASGNVLPNTSVTFSVSSGGGTIKLAAGAGPVTSGAVTTDAGGLATIASWSVGGTAGANTLEARVSPTLAVTFTASAVSSTPSAITIVSGNTQTGTVATPLSQALVVKVMDAAGAPVNGAGVAWTATNGNLIATTFTGADGTTSNTLTLGKVAGAASAVATIVTGAQQTFSATAQPGAVTSLNFTSQPPSTTVGVVLPSVTLELRDQFGNVVPVRNSVTLSIDPATGNLGGTLTRNAVNGVATFNDLAVNLPGTGYRLLATSAALTARSNAFNVGSNAVSFVNVISGDGQSGTVNTGASVPLVVSVTDANHAAINSANIVWSSRHGTLLSPSETSTGADGQTSITINYSTLAGTDTITATSINGPSASFVVTARPGEAVKLVFIVPNGTASYSGNIASAIAIPTNLQVAIEDTFGNVVTTSTATVSLTLDNSDALINAPATDATNGIVTWSQARITRPGVYTVTATSSGLLGATSLPISISLR